MSVTYWKLQENSAHSMSGHEAQRLHDPSADFLVHMIILSYRRGEIQAESWSHSK